MSGNPQVTPGSTGAGVGVQEGILLLPVTAPNPTASLKHPTSCLVGEPRGFAVAFWDFKGSFLLGRLVRGTWTLIPGGIFCCTFVAITGMFPCVSVQDIFLLPLLIFHDLILDSFKDQQHLLQPVFSPWRGRAKPTAECLAWKTPSARRERGVWEENTAFEAENFLASCKDWAVAF